MSETAPAMGAITRARTSIEAIRVVVQLRNLGRTTLTPGERDALTGWSGWGPLAPLFSPPNATWAALADEVQSLLASAEWKLGNLSTYSAFYTPTYAAETMWALAQHLGFPGGRVLEPGCGGGQFFRTAPAGVHVTGVERDPISAAVVGLLHPEHTVIALPLEKAALASGFGLAIGNVPFGDVKVFDATAPSEVAASLHNYFIWRAVRHLAPGGLAILLTSRYTMDTASSGTRRAITAAGADFLGAVRLPNGGLGGGTDALADLVVLRRRADDAEPAVDDVDTWYRARAYRDASGNLSVHGISVNEYWDQREDMVLGTTTTGPTSKYGLGLKIDGDIPALPGAFAAACGRLAGRVAGRGLGYQPPTDPTVLPADPDAGPDVDGDWWDGQFRWVDGRLWQMKPAKRATKTAPARPRHTEPVPNPSAELRALLELRDLARELVRLEADHDLPDEQITPTRDAARTAYLAYENTYGAVNRSTIVEDDPTELPGSKAARNPAADIVTAALAVMPGKDFGLTEYVGEQAQEYRLVTPRLGGFRQDPDAALVFALELYDDDTGEHEPAPILTSRQNRRTVRPARAGTPAQALAWSLDRSSGVDLPYIAQVLDAAVDAVPGLLGDLVYRNPSTGLWETAEEYLSGNVRQKLRYAEAAAGDDDGYARNVTALQAALPPWLEAHQIIVKFGAVWIPAKVVRQFIVETLEPDSYRSDVVVNHLAATAQWEVKGGDRGSNLSIVKWGTAHRNAYQLIEDGLNQQVPVVKVPVTGDDDVVRMVKDATKSSVAVTQLKQLEERFTEWLWEDPARRKTLVTSYNETYNALVARTFDGSHLTITGLAPWFAAKAYRHQWDYVARAVATRASLCGHPVGAGKTATMAMTVMKLIELGLIETGMLAVPKHLLEQTDRQVRQLFPAAKVLAMSSESIGANRRQFAARCATQGFDIVIVTHPAFDKIRVSEETEAGYLAEQRDALDAAIRAACPDGVLPTGMVKAAAKRSDRLTATIGKLQHREVSRDTGVITWEQLRIGWVGVDEAHNYKNLALPCRTDGFSVRPSKRATDLHMKLWWLSQQGTGPYVSLFTGTPVSNTMLELYVILQYLMSEYLATVGLGSADAWAATFVQMVTSVDVTVDGGSFNLKTRPALFVNAPELRLLLSMCAHICTREQLGLPGPAVVEETVTTSSTSAQAGYSAELVERVEDVRGQSRFDADAKRDNMLKICTDGRRMATDPKLVGVDDDEPGKLAAVAGKVLKMWAEHPDELQIVFCDIGTPSPAKGDQTYGRIKQLLVDGGMPADRIVFIHDAKNGNDKVRLFARCRTGNVSVIFGSTDKLGTGTNIQDRVVAVHHVDAPFRPSDVEQRNGRAVRPGNRNKTVRIFQYVTERTFDAYMWQMLTRKAGFITQILSGEVGRTVEDIVSDKVLSYAAIKASATGQPLLQEQAAVAGQVKELEAMHRAWRYGRADLQAQVDSSAGYVTRVEGEITIWEGIAEHYTGELTDDDRSKIAAFAADKLAHEPLHVAGLIIYPDVWCDLKEKQHPKILIRGSWSGGRVGRDLMAYDKPDKWIETILKVAEGARAEADRLTANLAKHRQEIAKTAAMLTEPFRQQDELTAARARLDQIDAELREAAEPARDAEATDKDLKAAAEADQLAAATPTATPATDEDDDDSDDVDDQFLAGLAAELTGLADDLFQDPAVQELLTDELSALFAQLDRM